MKKIIFLAALLLPIVVQALPFKPTSDPALASTFWYFVKYNEYYMAAETEDEQLAFPETVSAVDDYSLWCFVGDEDSGYRVYNKGKAKYPGNADLDGNGIVDVDDVNAIINIILKSV